MTKADQILESAQSSGGFLRPVRLQFSLAIHQVTPGGKSDAFCALPACSTFDDFVRSFAVRDRRALLLLFRSYAQKLSD